MIVILLRLVPDPEAGTASFRTPCPGPDPGPLRLVSPAPDLIRGLSRTPGHAAAAHAQSRQTYLTSVKHSIPSRAPSRPSPDCFMPPKGIGAPVTLVRFSATIP
jgi:hypothetical protein